MLFDGAGYAVSQMSFDAANGVQRLWTSVPDPLGRPISTEDPTKRGLSATWDLGGRLSLLEEQLSGVTVRSTSYPDYDPMGRLEREVPSADAPAISYGYDLAGRLRTEDSGAAGTTAHFGSVWSFDDAGRLTSIQKQRGSSDPARLTELLYDDDDAAPYKLDVDGDAAKGWLRDGLDRVKSATDFNLGDGTSTFNGARPELTTTLTYDALGRVLRDVTTGTFPSSSPTLPGQSNVGLGTATWMIPPL